MKKKIKKKYSPNLVKKIKIKKTYWRRPRPNVKGKRKKRRRRSHLVWKKKDEDTKLIEPSEEEKKKESESKVAAGGSLGVCLITEMPLKIELWKLKTPKMCFQFPSLITQKSKNKVMETKTKNNWKQKPNELLSYGSHHFWVMSYENKIMSYRNSKSKHPLSFLLTKQSHFSCLLCFLF